MLKRSGLDLVHVLEDGFVRLRNRAGEIIAGRSLLSNLDKPVVEVKGWVDLCLRERGKLVPGSRRSGHNVWTNTGREYLAMLMSFKNFSTPFRSDRISFIGVGTGSQLEEPSVLTLVTPIEYAPSLFLASLDVPPTFPLSPTRTTVRYHRVFLEDEITMEVGDKVMVSEIGLFTNGNQSLDFAPPRPPEITYAADQNPAAYKTFEPVGKTSALQLEVSWEIRF